MGADAIDLVVSKVLGFLWHISPALMTVVLGGVIVQKFFVSRANEASLIELLVRDLDDLRKDALEYWNLDCKAGGPEAREKAAIFEQRIKGAIKSLTADLDQYAQRYRKKGDFLPLMIEVSDACTGGEFESAKKTRDRQRYLLVVNSINRVRSELRKGKL